MFKKQNELIKNLTDTQIVQNLYLTQFFIILISIVLGLFLFDQLQDFLALFEIHKYNSLFYGIGGAFLVISLDLILMKVLPEHLLDDGGINKKIFEKRSLPHIVLLTGLIAVSEEILFRGILQTHYGIWAASLIFAVLHFRYLSKWVLFILVISVSFLLGVLYEITDTIVSTILAHFLIDLVFAVQIRMNYLKGGTGK